MQEPSLRSNCQHPSQPLLPRHGWAALPPRVITALQPTHTQEMKYSSRTYWLLQRLLGKVNETGWGKEMSVSLQGVGWEQGQRMDSDFQLGHSWIQLPEVCSPFNS